MTAAAWCAVCGARDELHAYSCPAARAEASRDAQREIAGLRAERDAILARVVAALDAASAPLPHHAPHLPALDDGPARPPEGAPPLAVAVWRIGALARLRDVFRDECDAVVRERDELVAESLDAARARPEAGVARGCVWIPSAYTAEMRGRRLHVHASDSEWSWIVIGEDGASHVAWSLDEYPEPTLTAAQAAAVAAAARARPAAEWRPTTGRGWTADAPGGRSLRVEPDPRRDGAWRWSVWGGSGVPACDVYVVRARGEADTLDEARAAAERAAETGDDR